MITLFLYSLIPYILYFIYGIYSLAFMGGLCLRDIEVNTLFDTYAKRILITYWLGYKVRVFIKFLFTPIEQLKLEEKIYIKGTDIKGTIRWYSKDKDIGEFIAVIKDKDTSHNKYGTKLADQLYIKDE